jgi:hypothetical protein
MPNVMNSSLTKKWIFPQNVLLDFKSPQMKVLFKNYESTVNTSTGKLETQACYEKL